MDVELALLTFPVPGAIALARRKRAAAGLDPASLSWASYASSLSLAPGTRTRASSSAAWRDSQPRSYPHCDDLRCLVRSQPGRFAQGLSDQIGDDPAGAPLSDPLDVS